MNSLLTSSYRTKEYFPFTALTHAGGPPGIPRGALTEIAARPGLGKTEWVLQFLKGLSPQGMTKPALAPTIVPNSSPAYWSVCWIEESFDFYPLHVSHPCLLIESRGRALWTAHQVLESQLFSIVVIKAPTLTALQLRRLQLSAERAHAAVILLSDHPTAEARWLLSLQVQIFAQPHRIVFLRGKTTHHERHLHLVSEQTQASS